MEQLFLFLPERIGNIHELLVRIHDRAADTGKMFQAQTDALRLRDLACQQCIGFHFGDVG